MKKISPLMIIWIVLAIGAVLVFSLFYRRDHICPSPQGAKRYKKPVSIEYQGTLVELSEESSEELMNLLEEIDFDTECDGVQYDLDKCYRINYALGSEGYLATTEKIISRDFGEIWTEIDDDRYEQLMKFMKKIMK